MKAALIREMREIDRQSIEEYGIPELVLMENAGYQAFLTMADLLGGIEEKNICVLAGSGNNGGDALAAARHLANHGAKVKIFLTGNPAHFTQSMAIQRDIVAKMGLEMYAMEGDRSLDRLQVILRRFTDGVLDGILGTGFSGNLKEYLKKVIQLVNEEAKPVVSIDIPSGVQADTGQIDEMAIRATVTLTLGLPKIGHMLCPGAECTGRLIVDDIGIPGQLLNDESLQQTLLDDALAKGILPQRSMAVHKGSCGRVLVVAGSKGMTGAAVLASQAVLRSGAGISSLAVAESLHDLMEVKLTEVMTHPVPELPDGILGGDRALGTLLQLADKHDTVLLGPGLGRHPETMELVRNLLPNLDSQIVLDADAIYAYRGHKEALRELKRVPVLTPHLGEMAALLEISVEELRASLLEIAREAAREYHAVFVVKSECTMVAYPDGEVFFSTKGNPGMATAGSGDVLSGTIAGLMKLTDDGLAPLAGVYLHGLAGDLAYEEKGEGLIATDLIGHLPYALKRLRAVD